MHIKGYNLNGKYIILTDKDFESAAPEKTKTIDLQLFVKTSDVDVILFDSAYYLAPAKSGGEGFRFIGRSIK